MDEEALVLLLAGRHRTRIPWKCIEGIPAFLAGRGSLPIGSVFSLDSDPDTLDGYLKRFVNRATAGWVAAVLKKAGIIEIDKAPPASVRLRRGFERTPESILPLSSPESAGEDANLSRVVEAWPSLPEAIRAAILAMVRTSGGDTAGADR
ncbi:MAG: hypothetical protein ACYTG0_43620 [Planctomycetota bacterium]